MALTEKERYTLGTSGSFYEAALQEAAYEKAMNQVWRRRQVIKAAEMPWENSRHGRMKHLINDKMPFPVKTVNIYLLVLPPGGRSGKHRHMAEEILYIVEGEGYDLHWDPDLEISDRFYWRMKEESSRYDWDEGCFVYIPPMVAHQHFNASAKKEARILAATNRVFKAVGYPDLEQLEDAPR